jgi:signal transduction histidine kinase
MNDTLSSACAHRGERLAPQLAAAAAPVPGEGSLQVSTHSPRPASRPVLAKGVQPQPSQLAKELQMARAQERQHLARELHDVLGGELTAARLQLACLKSRLAGHSDDIDQRLEQLNNTLGAALALKRRIIDGLEPTSLPTLGLASSLEAMARKFVDGAGIRLRTDLDDVAADATVTLAIYRLVQESLTNMVKYAGATEAGIELRDRGREVTVRVYDNGSGFDPALATSHSHGLDGMRHRVESTGGRLSVESEPGGGTRITATLPKRALPSATLQ